MTLNFLKGVGLKTRCAEKSVLTHSSARFIYPAFGFFGHHAEKDGTCFHNIRCVNFLFSAPTQTTLPNVKSMALVFVFCLLGQCNWD